MSEDIKKDKTSGKLTFWMKVEIPLFSKNKYEYDYKRNAIFLDRPLYGCNFYPGEYGYLLDTEAEEDDGDGLDVLCLAPYQTFPGCLIEVIVIGVLEMIDDGKEDWKIIAVPKNDPYTKTITDIFQLDKHRLDAIKNFFSTYKNLEGKKVTVGSFFSAKVAEEKVKSRFLKK